MQTSADIVMSPPDALAAAGAADGVVRTLSSRGLIVEDGSEESGAGLYRTTSLFLEKMGMQTLEELPSLAPLLPEIDTLETDEL